MVKQETKKSTASTEKMNVRILSISIVRIIYRIIQILLTLKALPKIRILLPGIFLYRYLESKQIFS